MGATSVTGVSGAGSVAGFSKGSGNQSLGVEKLVGPRVVAAGQATVGAGSGATVTFTVTGGALNAITTTPAAAGSGYPASSTIFLAVTGGGGTGGVVQATTGSGGTVTAFSATSVFAGSGYSGTTGAATAVTATVYLPESTTNGDDSLLSSTGTYLGYANDTSPTPAAANVVALNTNYLVLTGTAGHVLNWSIVKSGFAGPRRPIA